MTLMDLKRGDKAIIVSIKTDDRNNLNTLMALSIIPGLSLEVVRSYSPYVIRMGNSDFAIDSNLAKMIEVVKK